MFSIDSNIENWTVQLIGYCVGFLRNLII